MGIYGEIPMKKISVYTSMLLLSGCLNTPQAESNQKLDESLFIYDQLFQHFDWPFETLLLEQSCDSIRILVIPPGNQGSDWFVTFKNGKIVSIFGGR